MPGIILSSSAREAMKRPATESQTEAIQHDQRPTKRIRRVHHTIRFRQEGAMESLSGAQDELFFQSQLLRAISLSLSAQGFDGVEPHALEAFRGLTEEFILHLLDSITKSMRGSRREHATPEDFAMALANAGLTASSLSPFLNIPSNPSITHPPIALLPEAERLAPNLDVLLGPTLKSGQEEQRKKYVPKHLPGLPSRHTWKSTPVFPSRESDARKLRERATKEGVMAEQALRRLMEASKTEEQSAHKANGSDPGGQGRSSKAWEAVLNVIKGADRREEGKTDQVDWSMEDSGMQPPIGAKKVKFAPNENFEEDAIVNCDRLHWRENARVKA